MGKGFSGPDAATAAHGYIYQQLQHQVSLLSFMDCFRVIAWLTLAAVPLLLFVRRFKPPGKAPNGDQIDGPYYEVKYDFVLERKQVALAAAE